MDGQYNFATAGEPDNLRDLPLFLQWLNRQFKLISTALKGPVAKALGNRSGATAIDPRLADLTTLTLIGNATITLNIDTPRAGRRALIELTQDATGGRTVAWVNLLTSPPTISTTATKRTLVHLVDNGAGWIATVLASGY